MATSKDSVNAYMAAWNEADLAKRRLLLEKAWADDGRYTDPMSDAQGREALIELISGFQSQMPGATVAIASGIDEHHGRLRFALNMNGLDGSTRIEGIDLGMLA